MLVSPALGGQGGYLFVTFKNEATPLCEQVYFGLSQDGQTWTALNESKPVLVNHLGTAGARDFYLVRSRDGSRFFLIGTDLSIYHNGNWTTAVQAGSHSIVVWESSDLVNWSQPRLEAVAASDAGCTWAPEAIYDDSTGNYLVFWASTSGSDNYSKQRIWACRTTDFRTFSAPFIYLERSSDVIDADIVKDGSQYYRFTKDETYKAITMETSNQLMGTWTNVAGFTLANVQGYEGPECYQLASGTWCLIADHYSVGAGYSPFTASALASGSFSAGAGFNFPFAFRHGSVMPLSADEYSRVASAFQSSSRIQTHLLFNETSGTSAADSSGHGWNAALVNGPAFQAGKGGNAIALDGVGSYASLPAGVVYSLTDFTVSAWVKINSLDQWARIFDFGTGTGSYMFLSPKAGSGNVRFAISSSGYGSEQQINGTAPLPTGVWTHVAVSVQGGVGILYVNGAEVGRNSSMTLNPSLLNVTTQNWLGRSQFSGSAGNDPYFNGLIDDFRIYSAGLSASSIQALYNGTAGALTSPWLDQALGTHSLAGSAGSEDGNWVLAASGTGIQGAIDGGHFTYQPWTGDGIFNVCLNTVSANASTLAAAGLMFREDLTASARNIFFGVTQTGTLSWAHRDVAGGDTIATTGTTSPASPWLRLTRYGNVFTAFVSVDGTNYNQVGSPVTLSLPQTLFVGLAMTSGSEAALEAARFSNVSLVTPPAPSTPDGLTAVASGSSIILTWNSVAGASGYNLKRSTSPSGPFTTIAPYLSTTNFTDSPTADGSTYYYVVSGTNSGGESPNSAAASVVLAGQGGYLFVNFKQESNALCEQVYFGLSQDGQTWSVLNDNKPVLVSQLGTAGTRDFFLVRAHDGSRFFVIGTDLSIYHNGNWTTAQQAGSHSIVIWESSDLVNWSQPRLANVAASDAGCTWAPEAVYDDSTGDYLVFWASTSASDSFSKQRIWACRTPDFRTFSAPFIYIERANSVIDADIVKEGSHYYRFTKDETYKALTMETSDQLMGTWTSVPGFTLASVQGYEGPECYQLASGSWCLIADHYSAGTGYAPFTTSVLSSGSFTAAAGFNFPYPFRHGSVLRLSADEYSRVATAFQSSSRIQTHLLFNETTGTTVADSSGHGWNASLVNGPVFQAGKGGNAVSLDGSNDYVSLPAGVVYSLSDFTVSTWVKINSLAQWARIFDFGTGTGAYMFLTPKSGSGNVRFAITSSGNTNEQRINGTAPLPTGVWTHVAVSVQSGVGILYVNGVEVGRNSSMSLKPYQLNVTTQNWLGRSQFSGSAGSDPYFNGLIDDFRIYSTGLSASSIQALYNGTAGALGSPWLDQDLGAPSPAGSSGSEDGNWVLAASGTGIQGTGDQGHFTYQPWSGEGILNVRFNTVSANSSRGAVAGVMLREDLTGSARNLFLGMTQTGTLTWSHRDIGGGDTIASTATTSPASPWLRVTRYGNVFTAFVSVDGINYNQVGSPVTLALPQTLYVGMAMSSGSSAAIEAARFSNISIAAPAPPNAPTGLAAVATGTLVRLSWTNGADAAGYNLKRSSSPTGPFVTIASSLSSNSFSDNPTADGSTYYYVVSGTNSAGESPNSTAASVTLYSAYQQWKIASGLAFDIADTAAAGASGMPVLLKYALGFAPDGSATGAISPGIISSGGISFTRLSPAPVTYVIQGSSDLATWTDLATLAYGADSWTGSATVVEDTSTNPRKVSVTDSSSPNSPKRFYRLQVWRPVP